MNRAGFTLVELLVTITIVGILAAMGFSIFQTYKDKVYLAKIKLVSHDLMIAGETLMGDLDLTATLPRYTAYNTFGTWTTTDNDLIGNQTLEDLVPGHINDEYRIALNVMHYVDTNDWYRLYVVVSSCETSPGALNQYQHLRDNNSGTTDIIDTTSTTYNSNYGVGGANC